LENSQNEQPNEEQSTKVNCQSSIELIVDVH